MFNDQHPQGEIFLLSRALVSSSTLYSSLLLAAPSPGPTSGPAIWLCTPNMEKISAPAVPPLSLRSLQNLLDSFSPPPLCTCTAPAWDALFCSRWHLTLQASPHL